MSGTISKKIFIKKDHVRKDGTCAVYLQVMLNKERKRFPLKIYLPIKSWDEKKQRAKRSAENSKDYNLIIENKLAAVNAIEIEYRLRKLSLTMDLLCNEMINPDPKISFISFYAKHIEDQLNNKQIQVSTYKQQKSTLSKLKDYKREIYFNEINKHFLIDFVRFLKVEKKNTVNTIATALKNVKKYLRIANDNKIHTDLHFSDIKIKKEKGNREFLEETDIKTMYKYYSNEFIQKEHKEVLSKFLFSCFTGLRISDVQALTQENFVGDYLVFKAEKTGNMQRLKMSKSAKIFINKKGPVFDDNFTDQTINVYLKQIAKICEIKKRVTFHVARHTFATQFLINGGEIRVLQKLLGHSKIDTTMIYVHVVEEHLNEQIDNLDVLLEL